MGGNLYLFTLHYRVIYMLGLNWFSFVFKWCLHSNFNDIRIFVLIHFVMKLCFDASRLIDFVFVASLLPG